MEYDDDDLDLETDLDLSDPFDPEYIPSSSSDSNG